MAVQLAFGLQLRIIPLAEHLIAADGNGVREVQRPCLVDHRDAHTAVGVLHEHVLRDAARLLAEDDVRAVGIADLAVLVTRLGGEEKVFAALGLFKNVTVLFAAYSFSAGWKRGMLSATAFSLLRMLIFGFFPTVLILYLIYYNLLSFTFGALGRRIKNPIKSLPILVIVACFGAALFSVLDNIITPLWYGYSAQATSAYFFASLPFMIPQVICVAISVSTLFFPLWKVFKAFYK